MGSRYVMCRQGMRIRRCYHRPAKCSMCKRMCIQYRQTRCLRQCALVVQCLDPSRVNPTIISDHRLSPYGNPISWLLCDCLPVLSREPVPMQVVCAYSDPTIGYVHTWRSDLVGLSSAPLCAHRTIIVAAFSALQYSPVQHHDAFS